MSRAQEIIENLDWLNNAFGDRSEIPSKPPTKSEKAYSHIVNMKRGDVLTVGGKRYRVINNFHGSPVFVQDGTAERNTYSISVTTDRGEVTVTQTYSASGAVKKNVATGFAKEIHL